MRSPRFEQWFAERNDMPLDWIIGMWDGNTYTSRSYFVEIAWAAWRGAEQSSSALPTCWKLEADAKAQQVTVPASDFDMRGVLASNLLCWHRLTEAEAQDLICFFEKVRVQQIATPYDQQALELCPDCGWKAIMPGEPCFVCNMKTEAQQVAVPMSDDEMWTLWNSQGIDEMTQPQAIAFARAIEARHGIGAKK